MAHPARPRNPEPLTLEELDGVSAGNVSASLVIAALRAAQARCQCQCPPSPPPQSGDGGRRGLDVNATPILD